MSNASLNPFNHQVGYQDITPFPVLGYGLTIESIQWWLYNHDLSTNADKYNHRHAIQFETSLNIDITPDISSIFGGPGIHYQALSDHTIGVLFLKLPLPNEYEQSMPSQMTIVKQLMAAINHLYYIPYHNQVELHQFVAQTSDNVILNQHY